MLNLLNKSVKTIGSGVTTLYNGITSENSYKTDVEFCKFSTMHLNLLRVPEKDLLLNDQSTEYLKEYHVIYLIHSKAHLNIYYINTDNEITINCIFTHKFSFPLNSVETLILPLGARYGKELPIVGMVSNMSTSDIKSFSSGLKLGQSYSGNISGTNMNMNAVKNEYHLKFYSLKSKRVVHNLRFKKKILSFISRMSFFAVSLLDASIQIFENDKMDILITINTWDNNIFNGSAGILNSQVMSKGNIKDSSVIITNLNVSNIGTKSASNPKYSSNNVSSYSTECMQSPVFDITDTYLLYYNNSRYRINDSSSEVNSLPGNTFENPPASKKAIKLKDPNSSSPIGRNSQIPFSYDDKSTNNVASSIETIAIEAYKNISKLKNWSVSHIHDLSNLRSASNLKNNTEVKSSPSIGIAGQNFFSKDGVCMPSSTNASTLVLMRINVEEIFNRKESREAINPYTMKINVPFFNDGVGTIKFMRDNRHFFVGNKNSQMFYIYEIYPQINLKYASDVDNGKIRSQCSGSIYNCKIIYSLYRGITSAVINSLDISPCRNFAVISSNKGTYHIFHLPERDNQIMENLSDFDYQKFDEINQKVICGMSFDKIKSGGFLSNYTYKSSCKIINLQNIDVERNLTEEMKSDLIKSKFTSTASGSLLFTFIEHDPCVNIYFLNRSHTTRGTNGGAAYYLMKKIQLGNYIEDKDTVEKNENEIRLLLNSGIKLRKVKSFYKHLIEMETTDTNFCVVHNNPLFSFNTIKPQRGLNHTLTGSLAISTGNNNQSQKIKYGGLTSFKTEMKIETVTSFSVICIRPIKKCLSNSIKIVKSSSSNNYILSSNGFINDTYIHESLLCKEISYTPKTFSSSENIKLSKIDFIGEGVSQIPKVIVNPNNTNLKGKSGKLSIRSNNNNLSLSDESSSKENSITLVNTNDRESISTFVNNSNETNSTLLKQNFYQNKDAILENQIRNAIETNIIDKISKNNTINVMSEFLIQENYYGIQK